MNPHPYFKVSGIEPGRVATARFGTIDFSRQVNLEILVELYLSDFPYLKLTTEGKKYMESLSAQAAPAESAVVDQSFLAASPIDHSEITLVKNTAKQKTNRKNGRKSKKVAS